MVENLRGINFELKKTYRSDYIFGLPMQTRLKVQKTPLESLIYKLIQVDRQITLKNSWAITPVSGDIQLKHPMLVDPKVPGRFHDTY